MITATAHRAKGWLGTLHPRLTPIKNYTPSSADTGFDRLVDAMSTFGTDLVTDANSPGVALDQRALEQLAAHREIVRGNHAWRGEWRTLAE